MVIHRTVFGLHLSLMSRLIALPEVMRSEHFSFLFLPRSLLEGLHINLRFYQQQGLSRELKSLECETDISPDFFRITSDEPNSCACGEKPVCETEPIKTPRAELVVIWWDPVLSAHAEPSRYTPEGRFCSSGHGVVQRKIRFSTHPTDFLDLRRLQVSLNLWTVVHKFVDQCVPLTESWGLTAVTAL